MGWVFWFIMWMVALSDEPIWKPIVCVLLSFCFFYLQVEPRNKRE